MSRISNCWCPQSFSNVQFFVTPWTGARQAPVSMGFSRQEYWSGLPFPAAGDLPDPEIECVSLASLVMGGRFFSTVPPANPYPIIGRPSKVSVDLRAQTPAIFLPSLHYYLISNSLQCSCDCSALPFFLLGS